MNRVMKWLIAPALAILAVASSPHVSRAQSCYLCSIIIDGPMDGANPQVPEKCWIADIGGLYGQTQCTDNPCTLSGDFCESEELTTAGTGFYPAEPAAKDIARGRLVVVAQGHQEWLGCKGVVIRREYSPSAAQQLRDQTTTILA